VVNLEDDNERKCSLKMESNDGNEAVWLRNKFRGYVRNLNDKKLLCGENG
jgi:hypothetical protein